MSLSTLPLLPLEAVASHLDFSSLVSLANTNTAFAHLQPTEQFLTGQDFSLSGPRDGDFCPETYFEVEVVSRGLVAIKMDWEWRDQGYGNQKGQLWLQLVRDGQVLEDNRNNYFALAPHKENRECERREVMVELHPVVMRAQKGDLIRVVRNVGGGGGHRLTVKNFKMTLLHKRPRQ